jgi:DNA-directed RNA polymerase sigma subunit (sigma70/sigma32)
MTDQSSSFGWPADAAPRIKAARERGASFEAIARDFGVSFATVRNKAIALGVHVAVPRRRVLRQYGSSMLEQGASPDEAALKVKEMVAAAKAQARAAALEAKARRRQERIDLMLEQIAKGRERDAAVFEARSLGAALEDIGRAIGVTRERVRQICDHYAFKVATDRMVTDAAPPVGTHG